MAFQVVFAEILDKKVDQQKVFSYTSMRLRQIGEDLKHLKKVILMYNRQEMKLQLILYHKNINFHHIRLQEEPKFSITQILVHL